MDSYRFLSSYYNRFTLDVAYPKWADFFERIFVQENLKPHLILDLACGTGNLTAELTMRGYEVIGVDASAEMLMQAMERTIDMNPRPLFLNQLMQELDLYGTVDACLCCLDSINYITDPMMLQECLRRVELFLEPGGVFIFDVNTLKKFQNINDQCYVREDDDVYCVWQTDFDGEICRYDFDIFEQVGGLWRRNQESHEERYYAVETLVSLLQELGFIQVKLYPELSFDSLIGQEDRIFISARKRKIK